jgi:D-glycero-D-manno-heptose 1,7-bisphosphate phosphatase
VADRALFLDRDGTLIEDADYLSRIDQVRLIPGCIDAVARARSAGYRIIVVTNQSGVARGYFPESQIAIIHNYIDEIMGEARVDAWYYCPHLGDDCACRKPRTGMLQQAAHEWGIDLQSSWMIGDKAEDIAAGIAAGTRTIQVRTGKGAQTGTAADLAAAIAMILTEFGSYGQGGGQ